MLTILELKVDSVKQVKTVLKVFFFNLYVFILRESVHVHEQGSDETEGERESQAGSALSPQSPRRGPISRTVRS